MYGTSGDQAATVSISNYDDVTMYNKLSRRWSAFVITLVAFVCIGAVGSFFVSDGMYFRHQYASFDISKGPVISNDVTSTTSTTKFTLYRSQYDPLSYFTSDTIETDSLKYAFLSSHVAVVEPRAPMLLYVSDFDSSSMDSYFEFKVCEDGLNNICHMGSMSNFIKGDKMSKAVKVMCSPFDAYTITAIEYWTSNSTVKRTLSGTALCMYVRRELRTLTAADLSNTMDAMYTLWNVSEETGQALYGSNYHASSYFAEAHHFNAAWEDGDHIHEGLGFLPQHTKLSNMFELSIQAVNAGVSLPYWDYTIESSKDFTVFDSFAFTENTFGSLTPPSNTTVGWTYDDPIELAAIRNGRWAKIKVDLNTKYPDLNANFGYMRAPWNVNPSPYVSRFSAYTTPLPTCSSMYSWLQVDSMTDFLISAPYGPHASAHGAIGSVYGCDVMDQLREDKLIINFEEQIYLCQKWGFMIKELYRKNYLVPQQSCTYTDLDPTDKTIDDWSCGFTCNMDQYSMMPNILKNLVSSKYVGSLNDDQWGAVRDFICYGDAYKLFVGDHVESASPADPSFWPMHPTLDRILQAKYMSGGFSNTEWPTNAKTDYVCDKANCFEDGVQGYYDACCYGHYADSQLLDFVNGDKDAGFGDTNIQVMQDTDPTSTDYAMPYIYDEFSWDHCDEDFDSLLDGLKGRMHANVLWNEVITKSTSRGPH